MFAIACCRTGAAVLLALLAVGGIVRAQVIEIDEVISREVGIHVGGVSTPDIKEVVSREASVFIENGRDDGEGVSRELSMVVDAPGVPPQVTGYTVTPSADGGTVVLDWGNYNQWAVGDVALYRIYLSNQPFSDVTGIEPFRTVPGEILTARLSGLPLYQDHFIAIVAVDGLGNRNPAVVYSAAYILTKEVVSREISVAFNAEPQPPYHEVASREISVVRDRPGAPAPITDFSVTTSPIGSTATLDWSSYNQWAEYDVDHYRVYYSDTAFTGLSEIDFVEVRGEKFTHTFHDLAPWVDHYFAIVPVDALGASDPAFYYGAAYVISPEVISREVAVFMGQEPPAPPPVVAAIPVANSSFESPDIANFIYWGSMSAGQRAAFAWTGAGNGANGPALFNNGGSWGYANVPDGSQAVSLQGSGSISHDFNVISPGTHTLTWSAASRAGQVNPYEIRLNGTAVSPVISTSNTSWQSHSATFDIAAPGTCTITFTGLNTAGGDNSVGIDAVSLGRFESEGSRPFSSLRELVSRETSVVRPDNTTPAPVTFVGSGFTATTARTTYGGILLDWRSYNEWAQQDVFRYRIYVSTSFFSDVTGMTEYALIDDGTQVVTIRNGLSPAAIYHVAVVAEDVEGNFNPVVYSRTAKTAVGVLGDVANLAGVPTPRTITYSWDLGGVGDELADFVREFRVYFDGAGMPLVLPPSSRSWTAASLTPGTTHTVRITTVDLNNAESSGATLTLETPSVPVLFLPESFVIQEVPANAAVVRDFRISNMGGVPLSYSLALPPAPLNYAFSRTSLQSPGPDFGWVDASAGAALWVNTVEDDGSKPFSFPPGFTFPFYGVEYSSVNVCTNGFVSFTSSSTSYNNLGLPSTAAPRTAIAVLWRDWNVDASAWVRWKLVDPDTLAITWNNIHVYGQPGQRASFQLLLKRSGAMIVQVKSFNTSSLVYTVGVQNPAGNRGYQLVRDPAGAYIPPSADASNFAVQIAPMKSWLGVAPSQGTVPAGNFEEVAIGLDAAGFPPGVNATANLTLASNDDAQPTVVVPVTMAVTLPYTAPTISVIANQTITANASTGELALTIADAQTLAGDLTLTAASSDPVLLPVANIVFGGSGANRTVTATPAANRSGIATITVSVSDGFLSGSSTFLVIIAPTFDSWVAGHPAVGDQNEPDDDPDGDLLPNLLEYTLAGDPSLPDPGKYPVGDLAGDHFTLTYSRPKGISGLTYIVEASSTLAGDSWDPGGVNTEMIYENGNMKTLRASVSVAAGRRFLRLRVLLSP